MEMRKNIIEVQLNSEECNTAANMRYTLAKVIQEMSNGSIIYFGRIDECFSADELNTCINLLYYLSRECEFVIRNKVND